MDILNNTNLSNASKHLYYTNLVRLNDGKEITNLKFLNNINVILKKLENLKPNTKKQYLISIVSILKLTDNKKLYKKYTDEMNNIAKSIKETPKEIQQETLKENYITWNDVLKIQEVYFNSVKDILNKKKLSKTEYDLLLKTVILSLYIELPVRRNKDYYLANITNQKIDYDENLNYCDMNRKKYIYNNYKTKKIYGEQMADINDKLYNLLLLYVKHHPNISTKKYNTHFLVYYDGKEINSSPEISKILNNIFDKNISSSMLRHIFITNKFKKDNDDKKEVAKEMGHSVSQQNEYIIQ